jgi:hypothetical protein
MYFLYFSIALSGSFLYSSWNNLSASDKSNNAVAEIPITKVSFKLHGILSFLLYNVWRER